MSRDRWAVGGAVYVATLVVVGLHAYLLLGCQPTPFQSGYLSNAFDVLAINLRSGSAEVGDAIAFEGWERNGKTYMYFGPWPALLRFLPLLLWPRSFGKLTYLSYLLADVVLFAFLALSLKLVLTTETKVAPWMRAMLGALCVVAVGFGSPVLSLLKLSIYKEAILWGLALGQATLYLALRMLLLDHFSPRSFLSIGLCAGAALLARPTFGLSAVLLALAMLISLAARHARRSSWRSVATSLWLPERAAGFRTAVIALALPLATVAAGQMAYNQVRFGNPLKLVDFDGYKLLERLPEERARIVLEEGQFRLHRIPELAKRYFLLDRPREAREGQVPLFYSERRVLPLSQGSPWLLLAFAFSCVALASKGRRRAVVPAVALLAQPLLVLSYAAIWPRYVADFLPLFVFCCLIWLWWELDPARRRSGRWLRVAAFSVCIVVSLHTRVAYSIGFDCEPERGAGRLVARVLR